MEREIIRAATVKGEGARDIARRQKGKREDRKVAEREGRSKPAVGGGGDDTMEEDGSGSGGGGGTSADGEEARERYEGAVSVWNDACLPLKLSVEIVTNLCAAVGGDGGGASGGYCRDDDSHYEDGRMDTDTEMAWDSDREEKLMAQVQQQQQQQKQLQTSDDMSRQQQQAVISSGVPDRVLEVFGKILLFLLSSPTQPNNADVIEVSPDNMAQQDG